MKKLFLTILLVGTLFSAAALAEGVQITEVLTRNTMYAPVDGEYCGWIEITNTGDTGCDITDWVLTDSVIFKDMFQFKDTYLDAGESVLVYMTKNDESVYEPVNMAPFKLSKAGGTVSLYMPNGSVASTVDVPALERDESYALDPETGEWFATESVTPAAANTEKAAADAETEPVMAETSVVINELMSSNKTYLTEYDNPDWVELYNTSSEDADLSGWYISDDPEKPEKGYCFPEGTVLAGGEYMLLICDGTDTTDENGTIHTGFSLAAEGEELVLANPEGTIACRVGFEGLKRDVSMSRQDDGSYTTSALPSPGYPNTAEGASKAIIVHAASTELSHNDAGLYINEIMASTDTVYMDKKSYDWVEIVNTSGQAIDISGYGLSDKDSRPRKWRFPENTVIQPDGYIVVMLTGVQNAESSASSGVFRANFSLSANGCEAVYLSDAAGNVIDSVYLGTQRQNISFGRPVQGGNYVYFAEETPARANSVNTYDKIAAKVMFSVTGGAMSGDPFTLELSAEDGMTIYYTTDCTEPTTASTVYSGPLSITGTTVIRAIAAGSAALPSQIATESYLFDVDTELRVVSVVAEPSSLYGDEGVISLSSKRRNVNTNVEVYETDGTQLIDQGCRMRLMGQGSLKQSQKSMRLMAGGEYGDSLFRAKLFSNRDYTAYDAFVLRCSGQDSWKTRMHDSILTSLLDGTDVMYQETETCVVYLNGVFYGHMNMRERIDEYSICQWHGWDDPEDLDILENKSVVVQGSADDWKELMSYIKSADMSTDEACAYVEERVDIDNYFTYVAFEQFIANNDLGNTRWYKNPKEDNKWRWIAYDVDLSFQTDQDSLGRWLKAGGVGSVTSQDNTLFVGLMKNEKMQDRFFTILGKLMATSFTTENIQTKIVERYNEIKDEAIATFELFGEGTESTWNKYIKRIYNYAAERPAKYLGYIKETMGWTDEEMNKYFADAYKVINGEDLNLEANQSGENEETAVDEAEEEAAEEAAEDEASEGN